MVAKLIPTALCQGPRGWLRGDTTLACVVWWAGRALVSLPLPNTGGQRPQLCPVLGRWSHWGVELGVDALGRGNPGEKDRCLGTGSEHWVPGHLL